MPIGITEEHEELRRAARDVLTDVCPPSVPRGLLDEDHEQLPPFWNQLAELGWLGLHVPDEYAGAGMQLADLTVIVEELGRALAPGPVLTTMLAAAIVVEAGDETQKKELLPTLVDGSTPAAVAFGGKPADVANDTISATYDHVLSAGLAERFFVPIRLDGRVVWYAADASDVQVTTKQSVDATRRVGTVQLDHVSVVPSRCIAIDEHRVHQLAALLFAAEACGMASWCLDTATEYAKTRIQFGRPIGQFQAVKHKCADLLVALEQAQAATWDATRPGDGGELALTIAESVALDVAATAGKECIQILGGIGYTWEHDAHMYYKRALAMKSLLGTMEPAPQRVAALALEGARRHLTVDLPPEADEFRTEVRRVIDDVAETTDDKERQRKLADTGYLMPHWPKPYGRDASPIEQLVIEEEFRRAKLRRPSIAIGAWAAPTIIAHGTDEQRERFVLPTLYGDVEWCQLFSEPGAGSDLASLSTRAEKVDGGWRINGQKVWTSIAQRATHGILLARTSPLDPSSRHAGITYFVLDMKSEGVDIRPLRELTGLAMFNEVFFTDAFVPDENVIGEVGDGWRLARTTLANERVEMGSGATFSAGLEKLLKLVRESGRESDTATLQRTGELVAEAHSLAVVGMRATTRALAGVQPGAESSVRKLASAEHEQRLAEFGLSLLGPHGAVNEADGGHWTGSVLVTRLLTIAGGTSEVQRNVIAERLLGLPRDPDPPAKR